MPTLKTQINDVLELLKNKNNLPFTIQTSKFCKYGIKKCKKHHGEIVIKAYNQTSNDYQCDFYGRHVKGIVQTLNIKPEYVAERIVKSFQSSVITKKRLFKLLNYNPKRKIVTFHIYMTHELKARIIAKAKEKKINANQYIISRLGLE